MTVRKKLIEVALPLEAVNEESGARKRKAPAGYPTTLHSWWAQRPIAACRAVLFGQLVDDPSSWPELFPTEAEQDAERQRLFDIIEAMVPWGASNNEKVIAAARLEIARSLARGRKADGEGTERDEELLANGVAPAVVNNYLAEVAPPVHDPFAGGGSIPLEAQRLGLRAIATDLNPVAVLINKALIEIPPKFVGMPPVNPETRPKAGLRTWKGAQGLAEDVRHYGQWMRDEAFKRIGNLYPPVKITREMVDAGRPDLEQFVGKELAVVAWLWARTVASPNPALGGVHVPLVKSFWLSKKPGEERWVDLVVEPDGRSWRFEVRMGKPRDAKSVGEGTKTGRGDFRCILTGDPIPAAYIRAEGQAGRIRHRLMAIVTEGARSRIYLNPSNNQEDAARLQVPEDAPLTDLPEQALGFRVQNYGLRKHRDLFTARQLSALLAFADIATQAQDRAFLDARRAGLAADEGLEAGGRGAMAYSEAVATFLSFAISRCADYGSALASWRPKDNAMRSTIPRPALPMVMDFAEGSPFGSSSSGIEKCVHVVTKCLDFVPAFLSSVQPAMARQESAQDGPMLGAHVLSTDPPYYDNVSYADLSDFYYIWLRRILRRNFPKLLSTVLVPKAKELIAEPFRNGGEEAAEKFFQTGLLACLRRFSNQSFCEYPSVIYYAFKQSETTGGGASSTGWETFLSSVVDAAFVIEATWPLRTEGDNRQRSVDSNALATSVALALRKRRDDAPTIDRASFRRLLRQELPAGLRLLQKGNIAPVDMAQASIGPGMAIFSRNSKVMEADGSAMSVRTALQLINQALDEYLAEQTGEFGPETRFAVTWFETRGFETGPFGDAETLAKARNVSVHGVAEAGILLSAAGKVRLLRRDELPDNWDPAKDSRVTVWEGTQHLIKRLETEGEAGAATLLAKLGSTAEPARDLAYRLYQVCERKGWAEEARAYNSLVVAWPELARLAAQQPAERPKPKGPQMELL